MATNVFRAMCLLAGVAALKDSASSQVRALAGQTEALAANKSGCPSDIQGLYEKYSTIFRSGNRNAASYKWFSYIAGCAKDAQRTTFEALGKGFCPISGSPINGKNSAKVTMAKVGGGSQTGVFHLCCWPCVCDIIETVKIDTTTVNFGSEQVQYNVLVHGDPCKNRAVLQTPYRDPFSGRNVTLELSAPEIECDNAALKGATLSDNGYPIIGLLYDSEAPAALDASHMQKECSARAASGYNSGMGLIFRKVATVTPI